MISIDKLTVSIQNQILVQDIQIKINKAEIVGLVGASGSGKSTIFKAIFHNIVPLHDFHIQGDINIQDGTVQPVFQDSYSSFNPFLKIRRSLQEPAVLKGIDRKFSLNEINNFLPIFSLDKEILDHYPSQCSGGQLQRLAILRAVLAKPNYLIMDEPISGLDHIVRKKVIDLILDLRNRLQLGILFISHDLDVVESICDRIYVMNQGRIIEEGSKGFLPNKNSQEYTKLLFNPWADSKY